jgi:AGCS family alanine or glycine:cation symporter
MVQANSIATATEAAFGVPRIAAGVGVAVLTGAVILGGISRIGRVSEWLVPVMALVFLAGGILVIICHAEVLPSVLKRILTAALTPRSALGGGFGYGVSKAMRYGIARGVFTNEAGLGSSAIAHAAADVEEPAEEGMWGIFEVFVATLLVCTVTALVILTTGVYDEGAALLALETGTATDSMAGAPLSAAAFGTVLGRLGGPFVSVCLFMFAFSSLIGWSYYGERGLTALSGSHRAVPVFRMAFLLFIIEGSVWKLNTVWQIADVCNGLMALPNLTALLLLSPEALGILNKWLRKQNRAA